MKYTQSRAEDLEVGTEFIYGQSWHRVSETIDIYDDKIMLKAQSMIDPGQKPELCILKRRETQTIKMQEETC